MTIIFVRKAEIQSGKDLAGLEMAKKFASHIEETHGTEVQLLRQIGGNPRLIAWTSRHENLGEFEANMGKIETDAAYQKMVQEASNIFKDGSLEDQLLQIIE